jgi:hypothetical protein
MSDAASSGAGTSSLQQDGELSKGLPASTAAFATIERSIAFT